MNYFVDSSKRLHYFDVTKGDVPSGLTEITQNEFDTILTAQNTVNLEDIRNTLSLSPTQLRIALAKAGFYSDINTKITALSDDSEIRILWEYAVVFKRLDLLSAFLKSEIGLTDKQLDVLFTNGSLLDF